MEITTCLIYYITKYLIINGSKAEGALWKLNNLLNDKSFNCIVGSNGKFLKQVVGNMLPFVGLSLPVK